MTKKVTKCVVAVAGLGTRFLPATKAQPKEMLTIVDKPVIQYIVEEAVKAGITDIIFVTSQNKRAIEDHFDRNLELENYLRHNGKEKYADKIEKISQMANFIFIRQKGPYGNGTPVLNVKHLINDEPFAFVFGDDLFTGGKKPHLRQLMDVYEKYNGPVLTAHKIKSTEVERYGIIDGEKITDNVYKVNSIIEKPSRKEAPSNIASIGGYILTPDIFSILEQTKLGKNNELWLTDAILKLCKQRQVYSCLVDADYYDIGSQMGWLKANISFALRDESLKNDFKKYLLDFCRKHK